MIEFPHYIIKMVKESDTCILAGELRFMMNVDCSTPVVFSTADKMQPF